MYIQKTSIIALIVSLVIVSCGSTKEAYVVGEHSPKAVQEKAVYDEDAKLYYAITKDSDFAYITLNTTERTTQIKMMQGGVRVYFDTNGKKNTDNFIQYPMAPPPRKMDMNMNQRMQNLQNPPNAPQQLFKNHKEHLGVDVLISENGNERIINNELNSEQISVQMHPQPNGLSYRLKVPLSYIASSDNNTSIGIEIKGMQPPNDDNGNSPPRGMQGGGMPPRGGGGMPPGGMGGGGMPPGDAPNQGQRPDANQFKELQSDSTVWIPVQIK